MSRVYKHQFIVKLPHSPLEEEMPKVENDAEALDILRYRYFKKKMDSVLNALNKLPGFEEVNFMGDYVDASITAFL